MITVAISVYLNYFFVLLYFSVFYKFIVIIRKKITRERRKNRMKPNSVII